MSKGTKETSEEVSLKGADRWGTGVYVGAWSRRIQNFLDAADGFGKGLDMCFRSVTLTRVWRRVGRN